MSGLYSHTTRADGTTLTAAIYNADHQNHITNFIPTQMDDYSNDVTEMKTQTTPGTVGSESLAQNMAGELERLRYSIARHGGIQYWYTASNVANVKQPEYGAIGDGVAIDTTAIETAAAASKHLRAPTGTYLIDGTGIQLRPKTVFEGFGVAESVTTLTDTIEGTRIIQTAANPVLTTDIGDNAAQAQGFITLRDMTLLGGTDAAPIGTYGLYIDSSSGILVQRVWAKRHIQVGFYFVGSLFPTLEHCISEFNQDCGVFFDFGDYAGSGNANSNAAAILGGKYRQNKNCGIKLGTSSVRMSISQAIIESNGVFYPGGDGYGIYISAEARTTTISGCWFENNAIHIVVGDDVAIPSFNTIPQNTKIEDCQFWSLSAGTTKVRFNVGRDHILRNCEFFGGGDIFLNHFTDNPLIEGCTGEPRILDGNGNIVTNDSADRINNFIYPNLATYWTTSNCAIAVEEEASPAGMVPVYKVTPAGAGLTKILSFETDYHSVLDERQTIGAWFKTDSATPLTFGWNLASTNMAKTYASANTQTFEVTEEWAWHSFGRSIDDADTGNQRVDIIFTAANTDAFYVSGTAWLKGIVNKPYRLQENVIATLGAPAATPPVYGLRYALTGSTTTITNLTEGALGQILTIISEHAITITDGTNIFLNGSANFVMAATDTLTLIRKTDGKWYEIARSDNT